MRRPNPADPDELYFSNFYVLVLVLVVLVLLLLSSPERKASQLCRLRAVRLRAGSAGIQHRRPPPTMRLCCLVFLCNFHTIDPAPFIV